MKLKTIILIGVLFTSTFGKSQDYSYYKTLDFELHLSAGAAAGSVTAMVNDALNLGLPNALAHIGSATLVGVGKEIYDSQQQGNKFDMKDLSATILGGMVSFGFEEIMNLLGIDRKYSRAFVAVVGIGNVGIKANF